jgi:diguanylate cyclase (GGDEF)-like protein
MHLAKCFLRVSRWALSMLSLVWFACLAEPLPSRLPLSFDPIESLGADSQSILSLLQDKQGYIWIGTIEGGLYRYDGRRAAAKYTTDINNPRSLPAGRVSALFLDHQERIWVGTDEGLARFEPTTNNFTRFLPTTDNVNASIVRRIISDGAQGMWLATWGGLQHFNPASGQFKLYQADPRFTNSLAHNDINAIAVDASGGVWAATWPGGVDYLAPDRKSFIHFRLDASEQPNPKLNDVRAMRYSPSGDLWMGTDNGVVVWQAGTPWESRKRLEGLSGRVNGIDIDRRGEVWVSSRTEGLLRWDPKAQCFQRYSHHQDDHRSLPSNAINTTMEDATGILWVATFSNGVVRAKLGNYAFERVVPLDVAPAGYRSSNFVRSMAASPDGMLWLGGDDGLSLFDTRRRSIISSYKAKLELAGNLNHNSVNALYQHPKGQLWIGTSLGLNKLDKVGGKMTSVRFGSRADDFINTIAPGRSNVLWLGTGGSLIRYEIDTGRWRRYLHDDVDLSSRKVSEASAVLEDRQGRLWVGNYFRGYGLDLMSGPGSSFQNFRHDPKQSSSISGDKITCLHEDAHGTIWVGTTRGLNRVDTAANGRTEFRSYLGSGTPGPTVIESIEHDSAGMLWISTAKGLSHFDPTTGTFNHYSSEDGLTDGMYIRSSTASSDGRLYFGANSGFTAIRPGLPIPASVVPRVAISDIRIRNQSLSEMPWPAEVQLEGPASEPRALTLPWNATELTIQFAALHFDSPARNSFNYWLEGFDQHWIAADANHPLTTYTNLYPGAYRFHLRAINNKGLSSAELIVPILVMPPFWQTWWFRTGVVLLIVVTVMVVYRLRLHSLTRRARQLESLVKTKTLELQESNQKLQKLSSTDGLTELANRRCFDESLEREWSHACRAGAPLTLGILDVDNFKLYNDHYGHQAGDACLREVALVLKTGLKRSTDLAARYGGEEFVFIAPLTPVEQAMEIAEKIRAELQALALPHELSAFGCVTVSIGVAVMLPTVEYSSEILLQRADKALYRAKTTGRNCVVLA